MSDTKQSAVPLLAGILMGGRSRRLGAGTAKALLPHPQQGTFLHHVVKVARSVVPEVILLGTPTFELPDDLLDLPRLPDLHPNAGPLAGLETLLVRAGSRWVYILSCDLPLLEKSALRCLAKHVADEADAVVFGADGDSSSLHPCCACYHGSIASEVTRRLESGELAMRKLLRAVRTKKVALPDELAAQLTNVNTTAEYRQLAGSKVQADKPRQRPTIVDD